MRILVKKRIEYIVTKGKLAHGIKLADLKHVTPILDEKSSIFQKCSRINYGILQSTVLTTTVSTFAKGRAATNQSKQILVQKGQ